MISWKDIFEAISSIFGIFGNALADQYDVNLIFDFGMYEEVATVLFFKSQVREYKAKKDMTFSDVTIKSIKFSDNVDFKYTKVLSGIFDPLIELAGLGGYVIISKDCVIDLSKFTLERIENLTSLLRCSNGLNMFMPTIKTKELPNMSNMIAKPIYKDYKILMNNLKFAKEYCQDGFYEIVDGFARVKKLKLSNIKNLLKYSTKDTQPVIIAINELVLDCELTENIFKDMGNLRFTVEKLVITNKFSIRGYSKEKAENFEEFFTIKDDSARCFKVYEITSKDTVFSKTSKMFLETGVVPESIVNCFKEYELCSVIDSWVNKYDYWREFYRVCDVEFKQFDNIDISLAMTLISLITQENFYLNTALDRDYCNSENAPTDMGFYIKAKKR